MTRKHYEAFAKAVRENVHHPDDWSSLINDLIVIFKKDNPAFDSDKFWSACERK